MRAQHLCPWLVIAMAVTALLSDALLGGRALVPFDALGSFEPWHSESDLVPTNSSLLDQPLVTLPWLAFFAERLHAGEVPLWNPYSYLGQPIHGALTGALLWPLNWGFFAAPDWRWLGWIAAAKLVLAGGLCHLLARRFGLSRAAATAAGIGYALCGFQVVWLGHPHTNVALWLPLALLSIERLAASSQAGAVWRRDVGLVALWVAGLGVAGHVQTALHVAVVVVGWAAVRSFAGPRPRFGARALWRFALGGTIGAALAAPQLLPFVEYLQLGRAGQVLATTDLVTSVEPWRAAVLLLDPWFHGDPLAGTYVGPVGAHLNFNEVVGGHVGRILLALALLGAIVAVRRRDARLVWVLVGAACAATLAWQVPPFHDLASALPILGDTKLMRFSLILALGLVVLGGFGLDRVLERFPTKWRAAAGALVLAAIAIELVSFGRGFNPTIEAERVFAPTPTLEFLSERADRALGIVGTTLVANANVPHRIASPMGFDSIELDTSADLMQLLTTDERAADFTKEIRWFDRQVPLSRALAIRHVVARESLPEPLRAVFEGPGGLRVFEDPGALSRVFVARAFDVVPDEAQRLARLGTIDFDPLVAIVEEPPPFEVAAHETPPGRAQLTVDEPRRLSIDAQMDAAGLLVVADAHYPGWRATVDGTRVPIVRVDHGLRGVWLQPGARRVEMVYEPGSWRAGLALAGAGLIGLLGLAFVGRSPRVAGPQLSNR